MRQFGTPAHIIVQDIASLKKEEIPIPQWLKGTPTMVNVATREVIEGSEALRRLPRVCRNGSIPMKSSKNVAFESQAQAHGDDGDYIADFDGGVIGCDDEVIGCDNEGGGVIGCDDEGGEVIGFDDEGGEDEGEEEEVVGDDEDDAGLEDDDQGVESPHIPGKSSGGSLDQVEELHDWDAEETQQGEITEDAIKKLLHERGMTATGNTA